MTNQCMASRTLKFVCVGVDQDRKRDSPIWKARRDNNCANKKMNDSLYKHSAEKLYVCII